MRALKIATAVMGVLIIAGTMALVILVARRSTAPSGSAMPAAIETALREPAGTRIVGIAAVQQRLAIQLQGGGADRVVLVDPRTGAVTGHVRLAEP